MRLDGARALVTGASSGIGAAVAARLAGAGSRVLAAGRHEGTLAAVAARVSGTHRAVDLAEPGAAAQLASWAERTAGGVDLLVCNAGIGWAGPLTDMPVDLVGRLVTVNLTAHLELARLLLPGMIARRRGHLVLVSSIAGVMGVPDEAVYAATKAGFHAFADSMRPVGARARVGVSVVVPGVVDTEFFTRRGRPYDRSRPKPVPAERVAEALVDAVVHNRSEVFVPGWLRFPARLTGAVPGLVRALRTISG